MSDLERAGILLGIIFFVLLWTTLARRAAIDVDERGGPGWLVGILFLFVPPAGVALWLAHRSDGHMSTTSH